MLESITLKFTEEPKQIKIPVQGVTIFVGPNNSGKSLLLRELEADISNENDIPTNILDDFEIIWHSEQDLEGYISELRKRAPAETPLDQIAVGRFNSSGSYEAFALPYAGLKRAFKDKNNKSWLAAYFLKFFLIRLDGRTRFSLTDDRHRGDLLLPAKNFFAYIFKNDALRKQLREIVFDAFGLYLVIDALSDNNLRMRLSTEAPTADEQNLNEAARTYHSKAVHIKIASDGLQAFVGILCAVLSGDSRVILIDEPEAFLHPPLARKLGNQLTGKLKSGGILMASTHSSDFLIGCLQANPNVRVVRLEYSNGKSKGRMIDPDNLRKFFKTPLIRSANIISGLFHDGVVVTESDNDRAFYSEIYYRLAEQEGNYPSILFVNAQNKQTIQDIVGPLRTFGVPAAAVVDIDILKDGGKTWTGWLSSSQIPQELHGGYGQMRGNLNKIYAELKKDMKSDGGVDALPTSAQQSANQLFDTLAQYGVFAVRRGEVEAWLPKLKIPGKKTEWTITALERMGQDPSDEGYLKPESGDVWDFMRGIANWIKNPARKGTN